MSNITNAKILEQLWEEFQDRGGNLAKLCNEIDLSNKNLTETDMIDILKERILTLSSTLED